MQLNEPTPPRIISPQVTAGRVGTHVRTVQRMVAAGEFVEPIRISKNRIGFLESAVNDWILSRPAATGQSLRAPVDPSPPPDRDQADAVHNRTGRGGE